MNRRGFLTSLLAGVVAPMVLPGAGRRWVKQAGSEVLTPVTKAIINPAWVDAPYEAHFWFDGHTYTQIIERQVMEEGLPSLRFVNKDGVFVQDPYPMRFADEAGTQHIPPFKLV